MSGLFTSFGVGVLGLSASHNSLNATSHNIVNADTEGFVRQQVLQNDLTYNNISYYGSGTNQVGLGTEITDIRQVRDQFLDSSYRKEYGRQGFYEARFDAVEEVENLFGELEGVQFQNSLEDLWTSIEELAKEPESLVTRASLIQTASTFLERADNIRDQLNSYQSNLNTQVKNTIDRINDIGYEIHSLNTKIRTIEAGAENANDYRDQRNALLDELGNLAKITYHEYSDGTVTVNIEGTQFVRDFGVQEMTYKETDNEAKVYVPVWSEDGDEVFNFDVECTSAASTDIGYLKGLLVARGSVRGTYLDIPVAPDPDDYEGGVQSEAYQKQLTKYTAETVEYNNTTAQSVVVNTQAEFDQLVHGIVTTINDILSPNLTARWEEGGDVVYTDRNGNVVSGDDAPKWTASDLEQYAVEETDYNGDGTGVFTVKIMDTANAPVGMDSDQTIGETLFSRKSYDRYTETEIDGEKVYIYNEENPDDWYSVFSLGEIEVNPTIKDNLSKLPLSRSGGTGDYTMDVAEELADAWDETFATLNPNTLTQNTFIDYYTAFTADIANTGQTLKAIAENQETTATGIDNQRQDVMGVSTDEELTHMIKFQNAYNASSRYITVIDEMLEHIINAFGS